MKKHQLTVPVCLFYSYCHANEQYRASMERSLSLLQRKGELKNWSDRSILPGQKISEKIKAQMNKADIIVFLISQDFIASSECMKEWEAAQQLVEEGKPIFRIPIILEDCSWQDLLTDDNIKALPKDGRAIAQYDDDSVAWQEVYKGIKDVINQLRNTFTPKPEFLKKMEETEFLSQHHIKLQDIFVFLPLLCYNPQIKDDQRWEEKITNQDQILKKKFVLIHGEEMSGKTALGRHLFLSLVEKSKLVLHMDLEKVHGRPRENLFFNAYKDQFNGDYSLWSKQSGKTLILDNLSSRSNLIDFVVFSKEYFDKIIVTLSSDIFNSFFRDELRLADFCEMKIEPLTHRQQEELIKKRLRLSDRETPVTDGVIDQIENRVNSVIITNKFVPRYPFYVLSILQTYEGYMPGNLSITSHGHCYYVLIIATLIKAGISRSDDAINTCLNFAEYLAFKIYQHSENHTINAFNFDEFVVEYQKTFIIDESILNRLKHQDYGIITKDGLYKIKYMYYFFLGKFLSKNKGEHDSVIEKMCIESYVPSNHLTLLFIIHHTNDNKIINDILRKTMRTFATFPPALLSHEETKRFDNILSSLKKNMLSNNSVDEERKKERDIRDIREHQSENEDEEQQEGDENSINDVYRIFKNNEILEQVLRNRYGNLEKPKIKEIIETIADSGLRLVSLVLTGEQEIIEYANYLHKKYSENDLHETVNTIRVFSFLGTMSSVERIVSAINYPEIRDVVNEVVLQKSTPAYDLIGYFSQLDSANKLTDKINQELKELLKKHDNFFFKKVLSLRTQHYINTHRSEVKIEQSICSLLGIKKYSPRNKPPTKIRRKK